MLVILHAVSGPLYCQSLESKINIHACHWFTIMIRITKHVMEKIREFFIFCQYTFIISFYQVTRTNKLSKFYFQWMGKFTSFIFQLVHLAQFFNTINLALFISEPFSVRTAINQDTFSFWTACILKLNKLDKLEGGGKKMNKMWCINILYKQVFID